MPIIELDASHLEATVDLWERAELTRPWNPPHEDYRRALDGPSSTVLGSVDGGRLSGVVMVGHDGHRGWAYYLAVHPDERGTGVGRSLVSAAEAWVRRAGIPKIQLMVRRGNESAASFYRQLGYERSDVEVLARWLDDR